MVHRPSCQAVVAQPENSLLSPVHCPPVLVSCAVSIVFGSPTPSSLTASIHLLRISQSLQHPIVRLPLSFDIMPRSSCHSSRSCYSPSSDGPEYTTMSPITHNTAYSYDYSHDYTSDFGRVERQYVDGS
ncbi:hypothetical protein BU25DRAFT_91559 [Macroventuria anomochaeta]|uniref:Uncharacterized protein n=1 Tax=Macroventuria anomochaeta TaxID=301207 RepID=A0ACB6RXA9_9PLEO|nr:uncharacterized protein BU25DRAFT_91559 [Macroventuria anomochaeta]KAF2626610.1 hypothetical protein BU25DRAFT_91559 [Macroventuria anomochaeta]